MPVQGEHYLRQLFSPLPIDLTILLVGALGGDPHTMTLLCSLINGLQNPGLRVDSSVETDPRFERVVELLAELSRAGNLAWAHEDTTPRGFALALSGDGERYRERVRELYQVLGFLPPQEYGEVVTLPVKLGIGQLGVPSIRLRTRSLWELFSLAAASVDVPREDVESGRAPHLPALGLAGESMQIHRSKWHPRNAMVAVEHCGWWYFIDDSDAASKLTFRLLEALMSVRMAEAAERKGALVLTVPVTR